MQSTKANVFRFYLRWILWILVVQLVLINISAAIYAYRFTHFYQGLRQSPSSTNVFQKTWKLFTGPKYYKLSSNSEPPFSYENILLKNSSGIYLDAWYSTVNAPKGCVIFFHGITVNKDFMLDEASMFRKWGYNTLLVDFRGHGNSGGNTSTLGVEEIEDIRSAFDFAKLKENKKIILYGSSLGAAASFRAVAELKLAPSAIIADMPFGSLHQHFKARARDVGFPAEPFAFFVTAWSGVQMGFNGFDYNVASYAKKINCPVLLQWGEKDHYVSRKEIKGIFENIASSQKQLVTYPLASHQSFLQSDPMLWQKKVQSFLKTLH